MKQLNCFVIGLGENAIIGISDTWLTHDDDLSKWNVASSTHELFRCDRSQYNEKKTSVGVRALFILRLALE